MSIATADLPRLSRELDGIELGDARLEARARKVAADVAREPGKSFPQIYEDDAGALEGLYRLCNNPKVTPEKIHRAHAAATAARCAGEKLVLAAHDTTVFGFGKETERTGLGPVDGGEDGFYGHLTLMVSGDDGHRPLGIAALMAWTREVIPAELRGTEHRTERAKSREQNARESVRWKAQVEKTEQALHGSTAIIHLGDREADDYDFFADLLVRQTARFIIRAKHDRLLANADADEEKGGVAGKLRSTLQRAAVMGTYTLAVKDRKPGADVAPKARKDHPPRKARLASLEVRATAVNLARPTKASKDLPAALTLNAVWVHEPDCPADEEPIDWLLLTTEGIATESEVLQVIKHYQGRWRIEEFFKALKTGCAFERRQLVSYSALRNVMALFLPIAWRLLLLRSLAREDPQAPATAVLSPDQLSALQAALKKTQLSDNPTVREALLAVAALGGHLKRNGEPGWITLNRGYEKLLLVELGWRAHARSQRYKPKLPPQRPLGSGDP